jgi:hypothetical protein
MAAAMQAGAFPMPRFSICIPTRERHETLPHSIRTILQQTCSDFELIVQDNCSREDTRRTVEEFDDPRIIYHRSDERISMHANWEQALNLTSGEYVIFLGDDDGLLPYCLEKAAECVDGHHVDLLAWLAHTYYWPNVPDAKRRNHLTLDMRAPAVWGEYFSAEKGTLDRSAGRSLPPGVFCLDSRRLLHNWLDHSGAHVYVPTYHNLVSRRVIDGVRKLAGGPYFFNPLPDFGTLIANLYVAEEVFFYAAPLSMTGHAGGSSGGTHGDLESWTRTLDHFIAEANVTPEQLLPKVFEPFVWTPTLLAGCFENVKNQMFPDDDGLKMGWENFLRGAAAQVNGEPEAVRAACRDWILASARRVGVKPETIDFPPVEDWKRRLGAWTDPNGRMQFFYPDCDRLGVKTIVDAVNLAAQFAPIALYPTHIPWWPTTRWRTRIKRILGPTLSSKLKRLVWQFSQ